MIINDWLRRFRSTIAGTKSNRPRVRRRAARGAASIGPVQTLETRILPAANPVLVSHSSGSATTTANAASGNSISVSADGRFLAFESTASNIVSGGVVGRSYIYVLDRGVSGTGTAIKRVATQAGTLPNGDSHNVRISADGKFLVFDSDATNLVTGDTNGLTDVFVCDVSTMKVVSRVSVGANGAQAVGGASSKPSISGDGLLITFESQATNLSGTDPNGTVRDIYLYNRGALPSGTPSRTTRFAQTGTDAVISRDGSGIAYVKSDGTHTHIWLKNVSTLSEQQIDVQDGNSTVSANGDSSSPSLDDDGSVVVFTSTANNLLTGGTGDTNTRSDVFVRTLSTGGDHTDRVSVDSAGNEVIGGDSTSGNAAVSGDGKFVVFESDAANLVSGDPAGSRDLFLRNLDFTQTSRIDVNGGGFSAPTVLRSAMSANGPKVVYVSTSSNLSTVDNNNAADVFLFSPAAPVIGGFPANVGYAPNGSNAVVLAPNATLSSPGTPNFDNGSLTVTLTNGVTLDRLFVRDQGTGPGQIGVDAITGEVTYGGVQISNGYNEGDSTVPLQVILTSAATPAAVQALLQNISFSTTSTSTTSRTVEVKLFDGQLGQSTPVVTQINFTPSIVGFNSTPATWPVAGGAVLIAPAPGATVTGSSSFTNGYLKVTLAAGSQTSDVLGVQASGALTKTGTNGLSYGGTSIGTYSGGTNGTPLTVSFNSGATLAAVNAVLNGIYFDNISATPSSTTRLVQAVVSNGTPGGVSDAASTTVTINLPTTVSGGPVIGGLTAVRLKTPTVPTYLAPSATVTDKSTNLFEQLTVNVQNGDPSLDKLSIQNKGYVKVTMTSSSTAIISYGNVIIGNASGIGTSTLTFDFDPRYATAASVKAVIGAITFSTTSTNNTGRVVQYTIEDSNHVSNTFGQSVTLG